MCVSEVWELRGRNSRAHRVAKSCSLIIPEGKKCLLIMSIKLCPKKLKSPRLYQNPERQAEAGDVITRDLSPPREGLWNVFKLSNVLHRHRHRYLDPTRVGGQDHALPYVTKRV